LSGLFVCTAVQANRTAFQKANLAMIVPRFASCVLLSSMVVAAVAKGAEPASPAPKATTVELFAAMESGDLEVKIIPKDSKSGNIIIENKTNKPLTIKLPEAFGAVPVLPQFGCPGGGLGGGCPGGGMGGGNQGMGGGMMGGMGGGGGMMGGGMFNIGAERAAKVKMVGVCLDHGKKDPSPHVPYKLVKLEAVAKTPQGQEMVKMLARGEIDQHSAQAAVWNLENGLTWEELARKIGVKHLNGTVEPYFTAAHLQKAFAATKIAEVRAEKASKQSAERSIGEQSGEEGEE
jgi:hypothetical protein